MKAALALIPFVLAAPVAAHPHVFVEATVELVVADGALQGVRLSWLYDDFFSFLLTSDLGIDPEGDMILTPEEEATLTASVLDWPADYTGDLTVTGADGPVALGARADAAVAFENGRIRESHYRPLATPQPTPVKVQVYDPYFYVAYEIVGDPVIDGAGCAAELIPADLDAAYAMAEDLLGRPPAAVGAEEEFPMIGDAFADSVIVTCAS